MKIYTSQLFEQYIKCLYYATILTTGSDVSPSGNFQIVCGCLFLLAGAIIQAIFFGSFALTIREMNYKQLDFES